MPEGQLPHLPHSDNEHYLVAEMIKHLAYVVDRDAGNGDVATREAGLAADSATHAKGVLEERVQEGAHGSVLLCRLIRSADLLGNLPLPQNHAVQAGNHPKEVTDGVRIVVTVELRPELVEGDLVKLGKIPSHALD